MDKSLRPHYTLILISTIKILFVLILFYIVAVLVSPNRYYSAINLIKVFLPTIVLIYAYSFYFWHGVNFEFKDDRFIFTMKAGRKNHIEVLYPDIENIVFKRGFLEKVFGVTRIILSIKDTEKTYGGNLMVLEQYMVFEPHFAEEIGKLMHFNKN